jgi:superfamily II DNA or RNA helicase
VPPSTLAPGETVRIRDERWVVTRQTPGLGASVLDVRGRDRSNLEAKASFLLPFETVEKLVSDCSPRRVRPGRWAYLVRGLLTEAAPSWSSLRVPLRARISLLSFQLEPALAITHGMASRLLIADEVGLGKTIQAGLIIAEILERTRHGRALIVAPASLKEQWQTELHDRFGIDTWLADSTSLARLGASWGTANPWTGRPVTITSIDFVKRAEVMRSLEALVWDAVVIDEAHGLTGHSDRAHAAAALARRARTVVLLTATPHSGDDRAFESLCTIGDLGSGFPLLTFRRTRGDVGLAVPRRTRSLRVQPTLAERDMHRALETYAQKVRTERGPGAHPAHLAMTVLTRRACSSATSLARSIERRLELLTGDDGSAMSQMSLPLFDFSADDEPVAELSAPGLDDRREERRWLERILQLARRAQPAESKLQTLIRLLRRAREAAIVFTEYRDTLARLASELQDLEPVMLHGGLSALERRDNLRCFTNGTARLLLATDAASEGLNLQQRCRLVINLELPWTPLRLEQRIGRVERIGQSRRVHAVHLLAVGTAEESYVARLLMRTERATDALKQISGQPEMTPLRANAEAEALRIGKLRLLSNPHGHHATDERPPVTIPRRRKSRHGNVWGFHLAFTDSSDQLVWETLLGAVDHALHPPRHSIDTVAALVASRLDHERQKVQASLEISLHGYLDQATRRERALADTLDEERARLSATLLQRGLFDRRAERASAAQRAVVDEVILRCRTRLDQLAATAHIVAQPDRLAFVLIRR